MCHQVHFILHCAFYRKIICIVVSTCVSEASFLAIFSHVHGKKTSFFSCHMWCFKVCCMCSPVFAFLQRRMPPTYAYFYEIEWLKSWWIWRALSRRIKRWVCVVQRLLATSPIYQATCEFVVFFLICFDIYRRFTKSTHMCISSRYTPSQIEGVNKSVGRKKKKPRNVNTKCYF